jgi:hypothetical protein
MRPRRVRTFSQSREVKIVQEARFRCLQVATTHVERVETAAEYRYWRWTMKLVPLAALAFALLPVPVSAGGADMTSTRTKETVRGTEGAKFEAALISLERQSWEAWQHRDGKFFDGFLSDDHVEVGFGGVAHKADIVAIVSSPACVVDTYDLDHFKVTRFTSTVALVTYYAAQKTICAGSAVPSPVWASSLYRRVGKRWLNVLYQQTQIPHEQQP